MKRGRKSKYDIEINKSKVWNVAVYIRLSVQDGDKAESNSVINQKELLNMYLEQNKELKVKEYYIDDGFSGTTFDRPAFKKMMKDIPNSFKFLKCLKNVLLIVLSGASLKNL